MKRIAQINAFKADPLNNFAKTKPILFFAITTSIFYTVFFISLDIFLAAAKATSPPTLIRLKICGYIIIMSLSITMRIRRRWKRIEKTEAKKLERAEKILVD